MREVVPIDPRLAAADIVRGWVNDGFTPAWICSLVDISEKSIVRIGKGEVLPTEKAAQGIINADINAATAGRCAAWPVTRRLQALAAQGITLPDIVAACGDPTISSKSLSNLRNGKSLSTFPNYWRAMHRAYDVLKDTEGSHVEPLTKARALGWKRSDQWIDIDDPHEGYVPLRKPRSRVVMHLPFMDEEEIEHFAFCGFTWSELEMKFSRKTETIQKMLVRRGRRDIIDRINRSSRIAS